jgi:hypothetical protein
LLCRGAAGLDALLPRCRRKARKESPKRFAGLAIVIDANTDEADLRFDEPTGEWQFN